MIKRLLSLMVVCSMAIIASAQITTSSLEGTVMADNEEAIGATIQAVHQPTGTRYQAVTNLNGRFNIPNVRVGGPYSVTVSYIGFNTKTYDGLNVALGAPAVLDVVLDANTQELNEVVVVSSSKMKSSKAGTNTELNAEAISMVPTVSRSLNDLLFLTPQGLQMGNTFSVGGGNFRQSYVTVDGAAMNNAFGIGGNLPANGSPISLDALDAISVSITPFDVRQSGFTGGAINAVTKSGTNQFKGSAYFYNTNVNLSGNKVGDYELVRNSDHSTTYGMTFGGPIIKDKLFFFVNGEYEDNVSAGPSGIARTSDTQEWSPSAGIVHRPTETQLNTIRQYLNDTYNYDPGRYQGYSLKTPAYKLLARLDWNINANNKVNVRFNTTHTKDSNSPSTSTSPLSHGTIYPGGDGIGSGKNNAGRTTNAAMYFESSRYYQECNFTSLAAEWNAKWGEFGNTLRLTYSDQDEPRSYEGGSFPTVDILEGGAVYTSFGPDPFTEGNLRSVKTFVATDELVYSVGIHNLLAGVQYETNNAENGYLQGGNGYYVFSSWDDFVNKKLPAAYCLSTSASLDGSKFMAKMKQNFFSFYLQDQMNLTDNFKLTGGVRFELPFYPELKNNYNHALAALSFNGNKYTTDQLPQSKITVSPRLGFNWDLTGERKYILRGGTGYFVGRMPFVWLVSAVGNANCGQFQYYYNTPSKAGNFGQVGFSPSVADQIATLTSNYHQITGNEITNTAGSVAPQTPTIIDRNLKMNAAWKSSLAFDAKLPYDIDFSIEGIYSKEFNPTVFLNGNAFWDGNTYTEVVPGDKRKVYSSAVSGYNPCIISNGGDGAYYYSISASLRKRFDFGLDLMASYTYSQSKAYIEGAGDQVTSAYNTNRYSINGMNDCELGYGTYVTPNKLLISAMYTKAYAKHFATTVGLIYEGTNVGYSGGFGATRFSYTYGSCFSGDNGANNLLWIPGAREELDAWNFIDNGNVTLADGSKVKYTADMQRDDFWAYINQDDYLKNHKGDYAERGGAVMPWHHQLDFKLMQDFYIKSGKQKNTLQLGVDIKNLANLLCKDWGLYKTVNNQNLISGSQQSGLKFAKNGDYQLKNTFSDYANFFSTYSIQFSIRYIFN